MYLENFLDLNYYVVSNLFFLILRKRLDLLIRYFKDPLLKIVYNFNEHDLIKIIFHSIVPVYNSLYTILGFYLSLALHQLKNLSKYPNY